MAATHPDRAGHAIGRLSHRRHVARGDNDTRPPAIHRSCETFKDYPVATPSRPTRKRASEISGKRDQTGRFAPKAALAEAALTAAASYPPLKRVRLTMPEPDFARLRVLKERLKELDRPTRKNELVRAGLHALASLSDEALLLAVEQLPPAKAPKAPKPPKAPKARKALKAPAKSIANKRSAAKQAPATRPRKVRGSVDD
jgi:hypothetical protein